MPVPFESWILHPGVNPKDNYSIAFNSTCPSLHAEKPYMPFYGLWFIYMTEYNKTIKIIM